MQLGIQDLPDYIRPVAKLVKSSVSDSGQLLQRKVQETMQWWNNLPPGEVSS